ncbi:MAG: flavodoxin domain-containing protein [Erythrobacter sp.]|jgi:multimeric flavodoxin WrbA|nr:flavodoxin domain-containing protein [Erythrobacter sp.]
MDTQPDKSRLLIVWHSRTGASEAMANAAAEGAREAEHGSVAVDLLRARDASADHVLAASVCLFVCPENLATMSGEMKEFFDRTYYPALGRIEGRAFATIIAAGSDGSGAQRQIDRIAQGWRLKRVAEEMIVNFDAQTPEAILAPKAVSEETLARCREIGAALASGAAMGVF